MHSRDDVGLGVYQAATYDDRVRAEYVHQSTDAYRQVFDVAIENGLGGRASIVNCLEHVFCP
jgi:hypothetical protein